MWRIPYSQGFSGKLSLWTPDDALYHELIHILRLKIDETFELCDGAGNSVRAKIVSFDKKHCQIQTVEGWSEESPKDRVHVILGSLKPPSLEEAVAALSQLGVSQITVVQTDWSTSKAPLKMQRLEKLTWEALRVNKWAWKTELSFVERFLDLKNMSLSNVYMFQEPLQQDGSSNTSSNTFVPYFQKIFEPSPYSNTLMIGPERGFSPEETDWALENLGVRLASLGKKVLRAPLAAVAASVLALHSLEQR